MKMLKAILARWKGMHEELSWPKRQTLFVNKQFEMDFADVDKQATHDLRAQISQNENWMDWGFGHVPALFSGIVESSCINDKPISCQSSFFCGKHGSAE